MLRTRLALGAAIAIALAGLSSAPATAVPVDLQARIDAAPAGSTVHLPPGVLPGGIVISKSLTLDGAGPSRTIIRGGDSVVRVTSPGGTRPTVTLSDLTLTGGVARAAAADDRYEAFGGGLLVEGAGPDLGATVTLRRVVVSGNRAEPSGTSPSPSGAACPGGDCPYALAAGGGIASFGTLTLDHSVVKDNSATGRASDAQGGGVWSARGALTILSSTVTGNRAEPKSIGRFAEGGGVFTDELRTDGPNIRLTVSRSRIDGNAAVLNTRWPIHADAAGTQFIGMNANAGGLHIGTGYAGTVDRTSIDGNSIAAIDPVGEPVAFDSGVIQVDFGTLAITRSSIDRNTAKVVAATMDDVLTGGTAIEIDGDATLSDTSISRNTAQATGVTGSAWISNGLGLFAFDGAPGRASLRRVVISGNTATATSARADAHVLGVGVLNNSELTIADSVIAGNRGTAVSSDGTAQGGGIWNGAFLSGPPVGLAVTRTAITGNAVRGTTAQGGGLYDDGSPSSLHSTLVKGNAPDQVFDASAAAQPQAQRLRISPRRAATSR